MSHASPSPQQIRELVELFNRGRLEAALVQGEALTRQFPESAVLANLVGAVSAGLGRFEQSASSFGKAVQIEPDFAEAHNNLGNALNRLGRPEAAVASFRKALELKPRFTEAHNNLGNAQSALGKTEEAASSFTKAIELKPEYAEAHYNLGNALRKLGRLEEAISSFDNALKIRPGFAQAHRNLGNTFSDLGLTAEAIASYNRALAIEPNYAEAHYGLANALRQRGELKAALGGYGRAIEIDPDHAEAHNNLGNVLRDLRDPEAAVERYRRALEIDPDSAEVHNNLGNALRDLGKPEEAVASYERAIGIRPDYAEAHNNRGNALEDLGRPEDAVGSYETALAIDPTCAEAHNGLGNVLRDRLRRPEAAVASYDRALEINPNYAEAHNNRGNALKSIGRLEEAVASYARALQINPAYAKAHRNLSTAKQYHSGDPQIDQMARLLERQDLSDEERMDLSFALGKAYGDLGDYDGAYFRFSDGNRLRKGQLDYDSAAARELFARIRSTFSKEPIVLDDLDNSGESASTDGRQPIFVLGMPRSGTTLVEQILASHSRVYGAGELGVLDQSLGAIDWSSTRLSSDQLLSIRGSYYSALKRIGVSAPYVTDKNPLNFRWIGFVAAAMPEAKIVHVRRDARATCWSNFRHCFSGDAIGFAYDLQDIAEYYEMYCDLMAFWHERLPGRIYDLQYETLTEHQELETRKLLEHVGLDWEDQCLDFHETRRAVQTASGTQVRQKMYRGSSDEWRNYEKHLEPLVEALSGF
jgi:tetratricopeptide (TPR) repeat protein